eukprot:gene8793-9527_t
MAENQSAAGGARRSILVRMKTESSFNGVLLPPLNRSSKDLTARSDTDLLAGALEATEAKHLLLRASLSMRGSNINSPATSVTRQTNDDYSKDGFESSLDSLEKHVIEEERLAKEADAPKLNAIAPFLLNELQADDLIDRRFGWQRTGNIAALHNNKFDQLNAHTSPTKITRAHSAHSTHSRGRSESPRSRSRSRSRVHSAEGTRASSARESPRRDELRSGIVLESSMELSKMNQSTTHSVGNNHHSSHDSAMVVATSRPTSSNAHYSPSAPSSASGKRRSPLIINFIKAPGL